jgi:hypothetical protein
VSEVKVKFVEVEVIVEKCYEAEEKEEEVVEEEGDEEEIFV